MAGTGARLRQRCVSRASSRYDRLPDLDVVGVASLYGYRQIIAQQRLVRRPKEIFLARQGLLATDETAETVLPTAHVDAALVKQHAFQYRR